MSLRSPSRRRVVEATARKVALLEAVRVIVEPDPDADVSYLDQDELEERRAAYKRREWNLVGVHVEADVTIIETAQTLKSGYLWGIESDSEQEYLDEIVEQQWKQLRDVLKKVGVPTDQMPLAVEREWIEWRM